MNRHFIRSLISTSAVATLVLATQGCTDARTSVFIRQMQALSDDCTVSGDPASFALLAGVVDPTLTSSYAAAMLVGNQLVQRGEADLLRPETNRVQFYSVDVEVFDFAGNSVGAYSVPATGFADPASGSSPGYGVVAATIIDPGAMAALTPGTTAVSRVVVYGVTLGGIEVETAPWDFPILVGGLGCATPANPDDDIKRVCILGQDDPPDCRCFNGDPNDGCEL